MVGEEPFNELHSDLAEFVWRDLLQVSKFEGNGIGF
jgi:hypothetical protein